ncbi:MAG TPA: DUF1588 domain-containing protein [Polyangiaceae bacterium]|nr:DUF1588 domain-containing protein [Polyangiaceae bacterium]
MQRPPLSLLGSLLGWALLTLGCSGKIESASNESGSDPSAGLGSDPSGAGAPGGMNPGDPIVGAAGSAGTTGNPSAGTLLGPTLRVLTNSQYQATLRSLFPFADELVLDLEDNVALSGLRSIAAATMAISPKAAETYHRLAEAAAARAFADDAAATAFMGCAPTDATCAQQFITSFGRKAFRRSLLAEEVTRYTALYQQGMTTLASGSGALKYVVTALLDSPHFLYRVELGEPSAADPTRRVLSPAELASKLAYFLWNGPPDGALLDTAETTGLDASVLVTEVDRLFVAPQFEAGIANLFDDYLTLSRLESTQKLSNEYPAFTASLAAAMRQETTLNMARVAREGLDFRTAFNGTTSFVNAELAEHYGIEGVNSEQFVETAMPAERKGLLGNAGLLSIYSHPAATSPTQRGKFVRETLLCQGIPAPPPDVNTTLPDTSEAATTRDKLDLHSTEPSCAACHSLMDPIGLALENFDTIGAYRSEDNGEPIDASGQLDGVAYNDAAGLADALAAHPRVPECFSRAVFRYAWGRVETDADDALVAALIASFQNSTFQVKELLRGAALAPEFQVVGAVD